MAKVFHTDHNETYVIVVIDKQMKFMKVDNELLKDELEFFEKFMDDAEKLPIDMALAMGFLPSVPLAKTVGDLKS